MSEFDKAERANRKAVADLDGVHEGKRRAALTDPNADPNRTATDRAKRENWNATPGPDHRSKR